jgi:hypothetical protein
VHDVAADVVHPDEFQLCHSGFLSYDLIRRAGVVKYYNATNASDDFDEPPTIISTINSESFELPSIDRAGFSATI